MGYMAPVTLRGKQILQQTCKDKLDWNSPVPEYLHRQWEKWRREILQFVETGDAAMFQARQLWPSESISQTLQWKVMVNGVI